MDSRTRLKITSIEKMIEINQREIKNENQEIAMRTFSAGVLALFTIANIYLGLTKEVFSAYALAVGGANIGLIVESIKKKAQLKEDTSVLTQELSDINEEQKSGGFKRWI